MILPVIKFSHWYAKLDHLFSAYQPGYQAILVSMFFALNLKSLPAEFIEYDTLWMDDKGEANFYPLDMDAKHLILTFFGRGGLFTTIRPYNVYKQQYFAARAGQQFEVVLEEKKRKPQIAHIKSVKSV